MKNKLQDLRDHLFEQLERVKDAEKPEAIEREIARASAVSGIANQIIGTAKLELDYARISGKIASGGFIPAADLQPAAPVRAQLGPGAKGRGT